MRRETRALQDIKLMCTSLSICPDEAFHKSSLVMKVYRNVVWMTSRRAEVMRCEFAGETDMRLDAEGLPSVRNAPPFLSRELDTALTYLAEFAPNEQKRDFENKIMSLFETKWMVELIDTALVKVSEFPDNGDLYFRLLSKIYLSFLRYSEVELLEIFGLERSTFYERKKEALMLLGVALWGFTIPEIKNIFSEQPKQLA